MDKAIQVVVFKNEPEKPILTAGIPAKTQCWFSINNYNEIDIPWIERPPLMTAASKIRILHVEDNIDIALIVAKILESIAHVKRVETLEQARQIIATHSYDIALLDLVLPDGSGLDLIPELKAKLPGIGIIIHSAHETFDNISNVDAVISKMRTTPTELRRIVTEVNRHGQSELAGHSAH